MTLTVIVPTYDEADNVGPLIDQLQRYVPDGTRVLFVDDSPDRSTVEAIQANQQVVGPDLTVDVLHRTGDERVNGLAGAVTLGIARSETDLVLVMDGDLQHPPSTIPAMIEAAQDVDLVVASRYCRGGSANGLDGSIRQVVSRMSTWAAKMLFPRELRGISDPMTGFFVVRRQRIDPRCLQTAGFKILLEILTRHKHLSRTQVPLQFAPRASGTSKGTFTQGWHYLCQLVRLRFS